MPLLGIVPARGGSKRLRRKNLLPLAGRPLVLIAAENLSAVCDRVVISTDDVEIESVALSHGYEVHKRDTVDDQQTVAECASLVVTDLGWDGDVLLLQPTVPYPGDLSQFVGAKYPVYGGRGSLPTGVYWWPAGTSGHPEVERTVEPSAMLDIDTVEDYQVARLRAGRKRILIEYAESQSIGTGHRWRAETLAAALQHHDVTLIARPEDKRFRPYPTAEPPDLWITDMLDRELSTGHDAPLWMTFEDHSEGRRHANLIVNALYPQVTWKIGHRLPERGGPRWAVLRPEFQALPPFQVQPNATRVLVMFGGTDPAELHKLATHALIGMPHVSLSPVLPANSVPVAATMRANDLLITSAGRTVYEAAAVGIPSIVLAQNNREATHVHLGPVHGNIYLGLGRLVTAEKLRHTVEQVAGDRALRQELSDTARRSIDGKGLARIVHAIDGLLEGIR